MTADLRLIGPAYSEETERAVLGALFIEPAYLDTLELHLDLFYLEKHRIIFAATAGLHMDGEPIDLRTLQARLELEQTLDAAGGLAYLYSLDTDLPALSGMESYVEILEERLLRRKLSALSEKLARAVRDGDKTAEDVLAAHQGEVISLLTDRPSGGAKTLGVLTLDLAEQYSKLSPGEVIGAPTGFAELDAMLGGFETGRFIVLAGRPGMGKSSAAQQIAEHQHAHGWPSMIFSLEMTAAEYATRGLVRRTGIPSDRMRSGHTSSAQRSRILTAAREIALRADIPIDDRGGIRFSQVAAAARAQAVSGQLRILWLDHLGLLFPDLRHDNETAAIGANTRALKSLAKELGITVVALHQLNRECERRPNKRPILSDLRQSGSVEQDADAVVFIYRDAMYDAEADPHSAEFILSKNRDGATGIVPVHWDGHTMTFTAPAPEQPAPPGWGGR